MFGPPRVWEQLQQGIIGQFGSQDAVDAALAADSEGVGKMMREKLGLDEAGLPAYRRRRQHRRR